MANQPARLPERADVERLVRAVLAELAGRSSKGSEPAAVSGELVLTTKVVSLAQLANRLSGVSRVVAPRGAVFTPAARDELRKHKVAVASAVVSQGAAASECLVVGVAETDHEPAALIGSLTSERLRVERLPQAGLIAVVHALCEQITGQGKLGILMTGQPAAAMCLANRRRGVRAALGHGTQAVAEAVATIGANLLVIDPQGKSLFELRHMARELARPGRPGCPAELQEHLG